MNLVTRTLDAQYMIFSIEKKLEEAGYATELAEMCSYTTRQFRERKDVNQPKALTERSKSLIFS